jgi:hypothetical protein
VRDVLPSLVGESDTDGIHAVLDQVIELAVQGKAVLAANPESVP